MGSEKQVYETLLPYVNAGKDVPRDVARECCIALANWLLKSRSSQSIDQPDGISCGEAWVKYSTEVLMYRAGDKAKSPNEWDRLQEAFDAGWSSRGGDKEGIDIDTIAIRMMHQDKWNSADAATRNNFRHYARDAIAAFGFTPTKRESGEVKDIDAEIAIAEGIQRIPKNCTYEEFGTPVLKHLKSLGFEIRRRG